MTTRARDVERALREAFAPYAAQFTAADVDLACFWLLQAELLQLPDFGVEMLLRDLERLDEAQATVAGTEQAASRAPVPTEEEDRAVASVDAAGAPGLLGLAKAVRLAFAAVASNGAGVVGMRNAGALGVLGLAARSLAEEGSTALIAAHSPPRVAPWGGTGPAIGTNPLAVGTPRADAAPLVLDYATSSITLAALRRHREEGTALRQGVAIDANGRETIDAAQVAALLPDSLAGSLTGLLVEMIAGVAVGGRPASQEPANGRGALIIAFRPDAVGAESAAAASADLDRDWRAAGGHLPARFDALPTRSDELPEFVAVDEAVVAALHARGRKSNA